ncbi:MAG: hypothetical protein WBW61_00730, partial [Rhodanobacteraceae bacterium]
MVHLRDLLVGIMSTSTLAAAAATETRRADPLESVRHLGPFDVVELRRYETAPGERERFARYFDAWFPDAFEQLGCIVFGQFADRSGPTHFTWLRGFRDLNARPIVSAAFYYGPLWREHRVKVNALLPGASDNVLLLRPLTPDRGISVLPAVDPVDETRGAQGVVVAHIFPVKKGSEQEFAKAAEPTFAAYRAAGLHEAGVLVTLDVANNFPQLPIRDDGPCLVWLG